MATYDHLRNILLEVLGLALACLGVVLIEYEIWYVADQNSKCPYGVPCPVLVEGPLQPLSFVGYFLILVGVVFSVLALVRYVKFVWSHPNEVPTT